MGQQVTYAVPECWEEEKGLSQEDRRKRFRCKPDEVIKIEDIALWDTAADETLEKAVEGKVTDAREDEKARRKKKLKEEQQPKKESSTTTKKGGAANGPARKKEEPPALCLQKNFKYYKNYSHDAALNAKVALIRCDITKMEVEAIVNAANKSLLGGGGIDGAIHRAAGQKLLEECKTLNGGVTGETKITRGYDLPAEYILHTVGPIIMSSVNKREEKELESCYITCLQLCVGYGIKSVAFCGISSGIYGYPLYLASHMALHAVRSWLQRNKNKVDLVVFCTFLPKELKCYEELMPIYFPPPGKCSKDVVAMLEESYKSYDPAEESDILDKEVADELEEERRKEEEERERMRERMKKRQEEEAAKKKKEKEKKKKKGESDDDKEDSKGGDSSDAGEKEKEQDEKKATEKDSDESSSEGESDSEKK